jgi:transcriptional regulator with PAS, ATPase and Fis domain
MAKQILIHLGLLNPIAVTDVLHQFEGLEYEIIDTDKKKEQKVFKVYCFSHDDYGHNLEQAEEDGNITVAEVKEEDWEMFKNSCEFATMNFVSGHTMIVFHEDKEILKCSTQTVPNLETVVEAIPVYDEIRCLVIGSEDESFSQIFVARSEEVMLDKMIEWANDDVLRVQATKDNIVDEQKLALLLKRSREEAIKGGLDEKRSFYDDMFQADASCYYWSSHYDRHQLETCLEQQMKEAKLITP